MSTVLERTNATRAKLTAESIAIVRTLTSNGLNFNVRYTSKEIIFELKGSVHVLTAKRLLHPSLGGRTDVLSFFGEDKAEIVLYWEDSSSLSPYDAQFGDTF